MEKVTITKVFHDLVTTKYGPRGKTAIYTQEHPDVKMTTFDKGLDGLKIGDVLEITIEKNGQFTNFKVGAGRATPTATSPDIEARLSKLEKAVFTDKDIVSTDQSDDFGDFKD